MVFSKMCTNKFYFCTFFLTIVLMSNQNCDSYSIGEKGGDSSRAIYYNPVLDYNSADPYVALHEGFYYLILSTNNQLFVHKSSQLTNFRQAESKSIYRLPEGMGQLWAPEIHFIGGNWTVYFAMGNANDVPSNRMWAIQSFGSDPLGNWTTEAVRIAPPTEDYYAIDGTVLQYGNGRLYFIWSGCERFGMDPTFPQNLYIAPMSDPLTISGPRVLIREPKSPWEMIDNAPINEGPQILQNNGRTFVLFSASPAWSPDYCIGIFGIDDLRDPLVRSNWWNDKDECIFYRNDEQGVYGTGHASFTTSPDGTEPWVIYHAMADINGGFGNRTSRVEKFFFNPDSAPRFPRPSGFSVPLETPSGQP